MALLSMTLGSGTTAGSLLYEIRQRAQMQAQTGADSATLNDASMTLRINLKQERWAAYFAKHGWQSILNKTQSFTLTTETEKELNDDVRWVWNVLRIQDNASNREFPVTLVPARNLWKYKTSNINRRDNAITDNRYYAALVGGETSAPYTLKFGVNTGQSVAGDYRVEYYKAPEALALTTDTLFFPNTFLDIFIDDVVASILQDGGHHGAMSMLQDSIQKRLREFAQTFMPPDQSSNPQIQDAMGYGARSNFLTHRDGF